MLVLCCRDADAARVLRDVYRLGSSYSSTVSGMVDLSDTTISRLGSKLTIMRDLKVSWCSKRAAHIMLYDFVWLALLSSVDTFVRPLTPEGIHEVKLAACLHVGCWNPQ